MKRTTILQVASLTALLNSFTPLLANSPASDIRQRINWVNPEALQLAIEDLKTQKGFDSVNALKELEYIKVNLDAVKSRINGPDSTKALAEAAVLIEKQRNITLANPALDMDKIVVTRFTIGDDARSAMANKMCMPFSNYMGLIETPPTGYDAELCELSDLRAQKQTKRTIFKPKHGEGIADVQMHWNADKMLFASSKPVVLDGFYGQEYPSWHIYEVNLNGDSLKVITDFPEPDLEFADPCYLPDGRILFTTNIGYNGIPCEHGERVIMNLAIYDPDDKSMRKITFDQDGNWSPTVLNNGRIMYTRWEYTDLTHYFTRIVMHSNPDGTECKSLYGSGSFWPTSIYDMQQLPNAGNKFIGIVSGHHGTPRSGQLVVFDPNKGRKEADGVVQEIPFRNRRVEPVMKDRLVDNVYPQFSRPFPINDKYFVVTAKPHKDALWGVYLVDIFDNMTLITESEGDGYLTPIPVIKRQIPPVVPDKVNLKDKEATVFIQDIYEGEGLRKVPRGTVKKLRVFSYEFAYMKSPSDFDALGVQSGWDLKRELGTVDVETDGSAIFKVPANTPVSLQPLDENGNAIQWMRSWFTAMPGEVVSCVGCHEDQSIIPIPKRVAASNMKPKAIVAPEGGTRPFSYELEIQPILNKYCISCHDGSNQMDLTDKNKTEYVRWGNYQTHRHLNDSYYNIHPHVYRQGPEADLYVLQPYEYHASNSELIQMLNKGHNNVKLNDKDMQTLCQWIDFNAPYFGDFEITGRYKTAFEQYPRRQQLMQKYANVSTDWKKELRDYATYIREQGTPEQVIPTKVKPSKVNTKKISKWCFDADKAKAMQQTSAPKQNQSIEVAPGVQIDFVWIPTGSYMKGTDMGGIQPVNHKEVSIEKGFWMASMEISNEQYKALLPQHDSRYIGEQWKDHTTPGLAANKPKQPVIRVTWNEANEYCKKLSEQTGMKISLPTEEQWEWACRSGSANDMWYGESNMDYTTYENMADYTIKNLAVWGLEPTVPIPDGHFTRKFWDFVPRDKESNDGNLISVEGGKYKANPWGLFDMHGNVAEWTASECTEHPTYEGQKTVCGGSWRDRASKSTAWTRRYFQPWQAPFNVGFRVIISE